MTARIELERRPAAESATHGSRDDRQTRSLERRSRYRYLLAIVRDLQSAVTIDRLVDMMQEWEATAGDGSQVKSRQDVHEELYLVDLPALDRAGFLEFNVEAGTVTPLDQ